MFEFSIGTKGDQITPKNSEAEIGQRKELSKKDIEGLNKYYGCGNYIFSHIKKGAVVIFTY